MRRDEFVESFQLDSLALAENRDPDFWLVRRSDAIVGMTMAFARPDVASRVVTSFTGVIEVERGQGIATALKAEHARRLAGAGWRELTTWNMESNLAILARPELPEDTQRVSQAGRGSAAR